MLSVFAFLSVLSVLKCVIKKFRIYCRTTVLDSPLPGVSLPGVLFWQFSIRPLDQKGGCIKGLNQDLKETKEHLKPFYLKVLLHICLDEQLCSQNYPKALCALLQSASQDAANHLKKEH